MIQSTTHQVHHFGGPARCYKTLQTPDDSRDSSLALQSPKFCICARQLNPFRQNVANFPSCFTPPRKELSVENQAGPDAVAHGDNHLIFDSLTSSAPIFSQSRQI